MSTVNGLAKHEHFIRIVRDLLPPLVDAGADLARLLVEHGQADRAAHVAEQIAEVVDSLASAWEEVTGDPMTFSRALAARAR